MAKIYINEAKANVKDFYEPIEYAMSAAMAKSVLAQAPKGTRPQKALCEYVNTHAGLLGRCAYVHVYDND